MMKKLNPTLKAILPFIFATLISYQVQSQNILYTLLVGDTVVLSVTGITGNFQWQQSTNNIQWVDIQNANSNPQTLITTSTPTGLKYYRAIISSSNLCSEHLVKSNVIKHRVVDDVVNVQVGDRFHGGIVFHTEDEEGGEGLIAPLNDLGEFPWGCYDFVTNAASETDGAANTEIIVNACSERPIAASVCDEATINGYSDWFLPARIQLSHLYTNRQYFGPFGPDYGGDGGYWSSSEYNGKFACLHFFDINASVCYLYMWENYLKKTKHKFVRCIRSFQPDELNNKTSYSTTVTIPPVFEDEEICFVTVDTSVNKNKIMWQKTPDEGTEWFRIYKETGYAEYSMIGEVYYEQPSFFIDFSSQPESHGDKYKITVIDSCGHESELSYFHKTMNLTCAVNGTTIGLNWDDYVDESGEFVPTKFYIFRGEEIKNLKLYDSISTSFHSYNDLNVTTPYYYMIGIKKPNPCIVGKGTENMVFSNIKQNSTSGMNDFGHDQSLTIYPNPFDQFATLSFENYDHHKFNVRISDLRGKIMRVYNDLTINKLVIERGDLKRGIYLLELSGDRMIRGKLIVM